jgi:hypothetical protein
MWPSQVIESIGAALLSRPQCSCHARRAFKLESGTRHMQQAYIDRDVVSSRQNTLLRSLDAKPWKSRI